MGIWGYDEHNRLDKQHALVSSCVYCATALVRHREEREAVELYESLTYGRSDNFNSADRSVYWNMSGLWLVEVRERYDDRFCHSNKTDHLNRRQSEKIELVRHFHADAGRSTVSYGSV